LKTLSYGHFRGVLAAVLLGVSAVSASPPPVTHTPTPTSGIEDLLTGTWDIVLTSHPSEAHPLERTYGGQEKWWRLGGGIPLLEEFHISADGRELYDTAAVWLNAQTSSTVGVFCASFVAEGCAPFSVARSDAKVTMRGQYRSDGKTYEWLEVFSFTGPASFTQTLDVAVSGQPLRRVTTVQATLRSRTVSGSW
jgi:hypothetical protein